MLFDSLASCRFVTWTALRVLRVLFLLLVLLVPLVAIATGCSGSDAPSPPEEATAEQANTAQRCGGEGDRCRVDADCCGSGPGWELVCSRRRCKVQIFDFCQVDPSACDPCPLHPEDPSCRSR